MALGEAAGIAASLALFSSSYEVSTAQQFWSPVNSPFPHSFGPTPLSIFVKEAVHQGEFVPYNFYFPESVGVTAYSVIFLTCPVTFLGITEPGADCEVGSMEYRLCDRPGPSGFGHGHLVSQPTYDDLMDVSVPGPGDTVASEHGYNCGRAAGLVGGVVCD